MGGVTSILSGSKKEDRTSPSRLSRLSGGRIFLAADIISKSPKYRSAFLAQANSGVWIQAFLRHHHSNISLLDISVCSNTNMGPYPRSTETRSMEEDAVVAFSTESEHMNHFAPPCSPFLRAFLNTCPQSYTLLLSCSISLFVNAPDFRKNIGCTDKDTDTLLYLQQKLDYGSFHDDAQNSTQLSVNEESARSSGLCGGAASRVAVNAATTTILADNSLNNPATFHKTVSHLEATFSGFIAQMDFMALNNGLAVNQGLMHSVTTKDGMETLRWPRDLLIFLENVPVGVSLLSCSAASPYSYHRHYNDPVLEGGDDEGDVISEEEEAAIDAVLAQYDVLYCNTRCERFSFYTLPRPPPIQTNHNTPTPTPTNTAAAVWFGTSSKSNRSVSVHSHSSVHSTANNTVVPIHHCNSYKNHTTDAATNNTSTTTTTTNSNHNQPSHSNKSSKSSSGRAVGTLLQSLIVSASSLLRVQDSLPVHLPLFRARISSSLYTPHTNSTNISRKNSFNSSKKYVAEGTAQQQHHHSNCGSRSNHYHNTDKNNSTINKDDNDDDESSRSDATYKRILQGIGQLKRAVATRQLFAIVLPFLDHNSGADSKTNTNTNVSNNNVKTNNGTDKSSENNVEKHILWIVKPVYDANELHNSPNPDKPNKKVHASAASHLLLLQYELPDVHSVRIVSGNSTDDDNKNAHCGENRDYHTNHSEKSIVKGTGGTNCLHIVARDEVLAEEIRCVVDVCNVLPALCFI